jgi:hypothetical protein
MGYVEAANFAIQYCETAKRFYQRKKAKRNAVVAIKAVAHKLARACFHRLKTGEVFSLERASHKVWQWSVSQEWGWRTSHQT